MTITRERPVIRPRGLQWDERSLLPRYAGVKPWLAVLLALALTAAGVLADIHRINELGIVFQACYFLGCLLAVAVVTRKGLFGPMVQPPLLLAFAVPSVVLLVGSVPSGGGVAAALAVGTPLINGFPTMAITTGLTLAIGIFRIRTQRAPAARERQRQSSRYSGRSPEPARPAAPRIRRGARQAVRETDSEPLTEPILRVTEEVFARFSKSEYLRRRQL
ncbi:MAG: DUF6542 domain-containing protein [Pseudonocardiaceae bacterium]